MTPADDKPEFEPAREGAPEIGEDWFDRLPPGEQAQQLASVERGVADGDAGRTVPWEGVKRWMSSWGTAQELPRPRSKP